ncbi:hypothetical protein A3759_03530 [Thalassolituus sp. HI0120]|nr:hypothetical protein A3759_03530 [Thalassolituus sp. HI0120]
MFNRILSLAFGLLASFSVFAGQFEVLKKNNQLLVKERRVFAFVGSEVITPIPLPYKNQFYLMTPSGDGYSVQLVDNDFVLDGWLRTDAQVLEGNFLDQYAGNELFIQGKGISFNGGAKNVYISNTDYIAIGDRYFEKALESGAALTIVNSDGKDYFQFDDPNKPTIKYRASSGIEGVAIDIGVQPSPAESSLLPRVSTSVESHGQLVVNYPIDLTSFDPEFSPVNLSLYSSSDILSNGHLGHGFVLAGLDSINTCTHNDDSAELNSGYKPRNLVVSKSERQLCLNGSQLLPVNSDNKDWYYVKKSPATRVFVQEGLITAYYSDGSKKLFVSYDENTYVISEYQSVTGKKSIYKYYEKNESYSIPKIDEIEWGDNKVIFEYSNKRIDYDLRLDSDGSGFGTITSLVTSINVYSDNTHIAGYGINYKQENNGRNRISDIQRCYFNGEKICEPEVNVVWSDVEEELSDVVFEARYDLSDKSFKESKPIRIGNKKSFVYIEKKTTSSNSHSIVRTISDEGNVEDVQLISNAYGDVLFYDVISGGKKSKVVFLTADVRSTYSDWKLVRGRHAWNRSSSDAYWGDECATNRDSCPDGGFVSNCISDEVCQRDYGPNNYCVTLNYIEEYEHFASGVKGCYGPYSTKDILHQDIVYTWYVMEETNRGSLSYPRAISKAGCVSGDIELPDRLIESKPLIKSDTDYNGDENIYLRTFSKSGENTDECITTNNIADYTAGYIAFDKADDLRATQNKNVFFYGHNKSVKGLIEKKNSVFKEKVLSHEELSLYADLDGNGVSDEIDLKNRGETNATISIKFRSALDMRQSGPLPWEKSLLSTFEHIELNVPNVKEILLHDIDTDGSVEIIYWSNQSLHSVNLFWDEVSSTQKYRIEAYDLSWLGNGFRNISSVLLDDFDMDGAVNLVVKAMSSVGRGTSIPSIYVLDEVKHEMIEEISYGPIRELYQYDSGAVSLTSDGSDERLLVSDTISIKRSPRPSVSKREVFSGNTLISDQDFTYIKPAYHKKYSRNIGYENTVLIDNVIGNRKEVVFYQDEYYRAGLLKKSTSQTKLGDNFDTISELTYGYLKKEPFYHVPVVTSVESEYINGEVKRSIHNVFNYDVYSRPSSTEISYYSTSVANDSNLLKTDQRDYFYKRNSFLDNEAVDSFADYTTTSVIQSANELITTARNSVGTTSHMWQYSENTDRESLLESVTYGTLTDKKFKQISKSVYNYSDTSIKEVESIQEFAQDGSKDIKTVYRELYSGKPKITETYIDNVLYGSELATYNVLGVRSTSTSVDNISSSFIHDSVGRVTTEDTSRADNTITYVKCSDDSTCSSSDILQTAIFVKKTTSTSGSISAVYFDSQYRAFAQSWNNLKNETLIQWQTFDTRGRTVRNYLPCKVASCTAASPHTLIEYESNSSDLREIKTTAADGTIVTTTRKVGSCLDVIGTAGLCVDTAGTEITPLYIDVTEIEGKRPKLPANNSPEATMVDDDSHKTYKIYDYSGSLFASVEGHASEAIATIYTRNKRGQVTGIHTRKAGDDNEVLVAQREYNDNDQVISETNAVGAVTKYKYDLNHNLEFMQEFGADGKLYAHTSYSYDEYLRPKGRIVRASVVGVAGTVDEGVITFNHLLLPITENYSSTYGPSETGDCSKYRLCQSSTDKNDQQFTYTADGLLKTKRETLKYGAEKTVNFSYTYTPNGELKTERLGDYVLTYHNAVGGATKVTDSTGTTIWEIEEFNNQGVLSKENVLGANSIIYGSDSLGRITTTSTIDAVENAVSNWNQGYNHLGTSAYRQTTRPATNAENFVYDTYGQIDATEMGGSNPYDYVIDNKSNLTKLRTTTLSYSALSSSCNSKVVAGGLNSGITLKTGTSAWQVSGLNSHTDPYCYDQLGRQVINGKNSIEYFADGRAARIKNATADIVFGYNASGVPVYEKQTSTDSSKNYTAWLFDNGNYEVRDDNGVITTRIYPTSDTRVTFSGEGTSGTPVYHYVMTDTMGSTTGLAKKEGDRLVVDNNKIRGYTPYGSHRNPSDWSQESDVDTGDAYGFTGQRYLKEFGLYQFVGRIYDPAQGRFTGPDPLVPNPLSWKSYNPYAYVYNDPMGYTDPSGYQPVDLEPVRVHWTPPLSLPPPPPTYGQRLNHVALTESIHRNNPVTIPTLPISVDIPDWNKQIVTSTSLASGLVHVNEKGKSLNPFSVISTEGPKWWKSEVSDPFSENVYDFRSFQWRGAIVGFTFGFSYTSRTGINGGWSMSGVAGTDGRTLTTNNIDLGVGTPGFEVFLRGLIGINNTVDDMKEHALVFTGASGKRSASATIPLSRHRGRIDTRSTILEGGFTTSTGGAAATWSYGIHTNEDRWYPRQ